MKSSDNDMETINERKAVSERKPDAVTVDDLKAMGVTADEVADIVMAFDRTRKEAAMLRANNARLRKYLVRKGLLKDYLSYDRECRYGG